MEVRIMKFVKILFITLISTQCGCLFKGGKIIDGTNLCVGMTIPGTEWTINALDYVGGVRVAGNDQTSITVSNEVVETNAYFGIVRTQRHTKMSATIEPCVNEENAKE